MGDDQSLATTMIYVPGTLDEFHDKYTKCYLSVCGMLNVSEYVMAFVFNLSVNESKSIMCIIKQCKTKLLRLREIELAEFPNFAF